MSRETNITKADGWFVGEDKVFEFTIDDNSNADPALSTPVDITGYTFQFVVRPEEKSSTVNLSKASGSGITITNASGGVLEVAIDAADTSDGTDPVFSPGTLYYTLKRTNAGEFQVLAYGTAELQLGATR